MEPEPILLALRQVTAALLVGTALGRRSFLMNLGWDEQKAQEMANDQVQQVFLEMFAKVSDDEIFKRMMDRRGPMGAPIRGRRESVWSEPEVSSDDLRIALDDWQAAP